MIEGSRHPDIEDDASTQRDVSTSSTFGSEFGEPPGPALPPHPLTTRDGEQAGAAFPIDPWQEPGPPRPRPFRNSKERVVEPSATWPEQTDLPGSRGTPSDLNSDVLDETTERVDAVQGDLALDEVAALRDASAQVVGDAPVGGSVSAGQGSSSPDGEQAGAAFPFDPQQQAAPPQPRPRPRRLVPERPIEERLGSVVESEPSSRLDVESHLAPNRGTVPVDRVERWRHDVPDGAPVNEPVAFDPRFEDGWSEAGWVAAVQSAERLRREIDAALEVEGSAEEEMGPERLTVAQAELLRLRGEVRRLVQQPGGLVFIGEPSDEQRLRLGLLEDVRAVVADVYLRDGLAVAEEWARALTRRFGLVATGGLRGGARFEDASGESGSEGGSESSATGARWGAASESGDSPFEGMSPDPGFGDFMEGDFAPLEVAALGVPVPGYVAVPVDDDVFMSSDDLDSAELDEAIVPVDAVPGDPARVGGAGGKRALADELGGPAGKRRRQDGGASPATIPGLSEFSPEPADVAVFEALVHEQVAQNKAAARWASGQKRLSRLETSDPALARMLVDEQERVHALLNDWVLGMQTSQSEALSQDLAALAGQNVDPGVVGVLNERTGPAAEAFARVVKEQLDAAGAVYWVERLKQAVSHPVRAREFNAPEVLIGQLMARLGPGSVAAFGRVRSRQADLARAAVDRLRAQAWLDSLDEVDPDSARGLRAAVAQAEQEVGARLEGLAAQVLESLLGGQDLTPSIDEARSARIASTEAAIERVLQEQQLVHSAAIRQRLWSPAGLVVAEPKTVPVSDDPDAPGEPVAEHESIPEISRPLGFGPTALSDAHAGPVGSGDQSIPDDKSHGDRVAAEHGLPAKLRVTELLSGMSKRLERKAAHPIEGANWGADVVGTRSSGYSFVEPDPLSGSRFTEAASKLAERVRRCEEQDVQLPDVRLSLMTTNNNALMSPRELRKRLRKLRGRLRELVPTKGKKLRFTYVHRRDKESQVHRVGFEAFHSPALGSGDYKKATSLTEFLVGKKDYLPEAGVERLEWFAEGIFEYRLSDPNAGNEKLRILVVGSSLIVVQKNLAAMTITLRAVFGQALGKHPDAYSGSVDDFIKDKLVVIPVKRDGSSPALLVDVVSADEMGVDGPVASDGLGAPGGSNQVESQGGIVAAEWELSAEKRPPVKLPPDATKRLHRKPDRIEGASWGADVGWNRASGYSFVEPDPLSGSRFTEAADKLAERVREREDQGFQLPDVRLSFTTNYTAILGPEELRKRLQKLRDRLRELVPTKGNKLRFTYVHRIDNRTGSKVHRMGFEAFHSPALGSRDYEKATSLTEFLIGQKDYLPEAGVERLEWFAEGIFDRLSDLNAANKKLRILVVGSSHRVVQKNLAAMTITLRAVFEQALGKHPDAYSGSVDDFIKDKLVVIPVKKTGYSPALLVDVVSADEMGVDGPDASGGLGAPGGSNQAPVTKVQPHEVVLPTLSGADGREFALLSDAASYDHHRAQLRFASDESLRVMFRQDSEQLVESATPWAHTTTDGRTRPIVLVLNSRNGRFPVRTVDGAERDLSPEDMAEVIAGSEAFQRLTAGPVRRPLVLINENDDADPSVASAVNARLLAKLSELTGPRESYDYEGVVLHVPTLVVPAYAGFTVHTSLASGEVARFGTGSVFGFGTNDPVGAEPPTTADLDRAVAERGLPPDRPRVYVVVDSPDGTFARVTLSDGSVREVTGSQLGETLWSDEAFQTAMRAVPQPLVVVVARDGGKRANTGGLGFDLAGFLHTKNIFPDVAAATGGVEIGAGGVTLAEDTEFVLVSDLRDGDLDVDVLTNETEEQVGLFVRYDGDEQEHQKAREWAADVTLDSFHIGADGKADKLKSLPAVEAPMMVFVSTDERGYRARRRDGQPQRPSATQLFRVLRSHPEVKYTMLARNNDREILVTAVEGKVRDAAKIAETFVPGGRSRRVHVPLDPIVLKPGGIEITKAGLVTYAPPQPGKDGVVTRSFVDDKHGIYAVHFPQTSEDADDHTTFLRRQNAWTRRYYLRYVPTETLDESGSAIHRQVAYLAPPASAKHVVQLMGHGGTTGFKAGLSTDDPLEVGDSVTLAPEEYLKIVLASDLWQQVHLDDFEVWSFSCDVNVAGLVDESGKPVLNPAERLKSAWKDLNSTPKKVRAGSGRVGTHLDLGLFEVLDNGVYGEVDPDDQTDEATLVPLRDLAANNIDPISLKFPPASTTLSDEQIKQLEAFTRSVARSAAWRARNGVALPKVTLKAGGQSGVVDAEDRQDALHDVVLTTLRTEARLLATHGLGFQVDEVTVEFEDGADEDVDIARVEVDLQAHDLGLTALDALEKEVDEASYYAVNKAFAKLLPDGQEALVAPPDSELGTAPAARQVEASSRDAKARLRLQKSVPVQTAGRYHLSSSNSSGGVSYLPRGKVSQTALPAADGKPFNVFVTGRDGWFMVDGVPVNGAQLAEHVRRSPMLRAAPGVTVRLVVDIDDEHRAELLGQAREFAATLAEDDEDLAVEAMFDELVTNAEGIAVPKHGRPFERVDLRPEDVAWLSLTSLDGPFGMALASQARVKFDVEANLNASTANSRRVVTLEYVDEQGGVTHRPIRAKWESSVGGRRVQPVELLLDAAGDKFLVPMPDGTTVAVPAAVMARLITGSAMFQELTGGPVQPELIVITRDLSADPSAKSLLNAALLTAMNKRPTRWLTYDYAGPVVHGEDEGAGFLALPQDALITESDPLSVSEVMHVRQGSVFVFPTPDGAVTSVNTLAQAKDMSVIVPDRLLGKYAKPGKEPLVAVVDSPDGTVARLGSAAGAQHEQDGARLARRMLDDPAFLAEVKADPDRTVVLLASHGGQLVNFGGLGFDYAGELHAKGIFNDVVAPPGTWDVVDGKVVLPDDAELALVSELRAGDLETEVLRNSLGQAVGLFVRAPGDDAEYAAAKAWAWNAVAETLATVNTPGGTGKHGQKSPWTGQPLPFFIFASSHRYGYRASRRATGKRKRPTEVVFTPEQLARVLRAMPEVTAALGKGKWPGSVRSIVFGSLDGPATGGAEISRSMVKGGYSRPLYVSPGQLKLGADGQINLGGDDFLEFLPDIGPDDVVVHPMYTKQLGHYGQYFPRDHVDATWLDVSARTQSKVGLQYYFQNVSGEYVAVLTPWAGGGDLWITDGHGSPRGLDVGLKTDRPADIGDTVVLDGRAAAKLAVATDVFAKVPEGERGKPHLLSCCSFEAQGPEFKSQWSTANKRDVRHFVATSDWTMYSPRATRFFRDSGRFVEVDPKLAHRVPAVRLAELAASAIDSETIRFGPKEKTVQIGEVVKVEDVARKTARAAAWRARNGVELPVVTITGHGNGSLSVPGTGRVTGKRRANAVKARFLEALARESDRLSRLGLGFDPEQVVIRTVGAEVPPGGDRTATIDIALSPHDLGENALNDAKKEISVRTIAAVDKAFAKLLPDGQEALVAPPDSGRVPRKDVRVRTLTSRGGRQAGAVFQPAPRVHAESSAGGALRELAERLLTEVRPSPAGDSGQDVEDRTDLESVSSTSTAAESTAPEGVEESPSGVRIYSRPFVSEVDDDELVDSDASTIAEAVDGGVVTTEGGIHVFQRPLPFAGAASDLESEAFDEEQSSDAPGVEDLSPAESRTRLA
ncbi:hypothetical protein SAMN05421871_1231, partial [Actinokineospora alba]